MSLPADIARCPGNGTKRGEPDGDCLSCARRQAGIADYIAGKSCDWMEPPEQVPCPDRLTPKEPRHA